jgi:PPOX class probable F420-dependent enzyme
MAELDEKHLAFLNNPYVGTATTLRSDGSPHNTVVWVDVGEDGVGFNTEEGRAKPRHLERNPQVALTVIDPQNSFRWISISGRAEVTFEGADEQIDRLAKKYIDQDVYPWRVEGKRRISVLIHPEKVDAYGFDE